MEVKTCRICDLNEADYNPRITLVETDEEYQKLQRSISEFGYITPIIVNEKNNTVIGGHQRLNVLKALGYSEIECVFVTMNETDEKLLNIALNKIDGKWDFGELGNILKEMQDNDVDTTLTGFSVAEISSIIDGFDNTLDDYDVEDKNSSNDDEIKCRIGEFSFSLSFAEFEKILVSIKINVGSQVQVVETELSRRLLNG